MEGSSNKKRHPNPFISPHFRSTPSIARRFKLQNEILYASRWVNGSMAVLQEFSLPNNDRNWLSAAYFGLSIRHQAALVNLFKNKLPHSALALIRPQLEAFIRGTWIRRCATAEQIAKLSGTELDIKFPAVPKMIDAIERTPAYCNGSLSSYRKQSFDIHNDFTHGGKRQLAFLNAGGHINDAVDHKTVTAALRNSTRLGLLAAIEMCALDDGNHLIEQLMQLHGRIYPASQKPNQATHPFIRPPEKQ